MSKMAVEENKAEAQGSDHSEFEEFKAWREQRKADKAAEEAANAPKEYYVHLADGNVVSMSADDLGAAGSHVDGVQVIATYEKGA